MRRINISTTMLQAYKGCPKLYEFRYIERLKPEKPAEYLETGSNYHACVESILQGKPYVAEGVVGSMARAFERHIPWREWNIAHVEHDFDVTLTPFCHMVGRLDAVCDDGTPVEHKTTRASIDEKYIQALAWDDQISFYLLALSKIQGQPVTRVIYTVCQKPTIRQKQNETEEEFLARVDEWYDDGRIAVVDAVRSPAELEEVEEEVRCIASELRRRKHFYRNPKHCSILGCEFSSICLNYDPEMIAGFVRKEPVPCGF